MVTWSVKAQMPNYRDCNGIVFEHRSRQPVFCVVERIDISARLSVPHPPVSGDMAVGLCCVGLRWLTAVKTRFRSGVKEETLTQLL